LHAPSPQRPNSDMVRENVAPHFDDQASSLIDTGLGHVARAMISARGFLGMGQRRFAIPRSDVMPMLTAPAPCD
jgi:hypothetical protein